MEFSVRGKNFYMCTISCYCTLQIELFDVGVLVLSSLLLVGRVGD